jgi:fumarate hydratase class II
MLLLLNVRALRDLLRKFGWGGLHAASAVGDSSTALSPIIGYDKASKIAHLTNDEGRKEAALQSGKIVNQVPVPMSRSVRSASMTMR